MKNAYLPAAYPLGRIVENSNMRHMNRKFTAQSRMGLLV